MRVLNSLLTRPGSHVYKGPALTLCLSLTFLKDAASTNHSLSRAAGRMLADNDKCLRAPAGSRAGGRDQHWPQLGAGVSASHAGCPKARNGSSRPPQA